jgi:hypothetical protein
MEQVVTVALDLDSAVLLLMKGMNLALGNHFNRAIPFYSAGASQKNGFWQPLIYFFDRVV